MKHKAVPETFGMERGAVKGSALWFYIVAAAFSVAINLLMLVSPLYMLQVYDRVLTSGSVETLILVSGAALGLLAVYGFADDARRKTMAMVGDFVQAKYGPAILRGSFNDPQTARALPSRLADLSTVQAYYQNGLSLPLFDLPFTPFFFLAMFFVHPLVGWIGLAGAVLLALVTIVTELASRKPVRAAQAAERDAAGFVDELGRNRAAIQSHGMLEPLLAKWSSRKTRAMALTDEGSRASGFFGAQARGFRHMLQIAALGAGAWLVLQQEVSGGAMIAGSILLGRALAPIDQTLGTWRQLVRARQAWDGLRAAHKGSAAQPADITPLPRPEASLYAEGLVVASPGAERPLLPKFNLNLGGGTLLLVLGTSGTGKTSLLQTLTGVWPARDGIVRLGGRDLHRWPGPDRGQHVGFAPQDAELLPGTIAENICRFSGAPAEAVIAATQAAGFHEMIVRLPDGYDTVIGNEGAYLSRGQKQAVSLARAMFGEPLLIALDEPSANLDQIAAEQLRRSLLAAKARGAIVIAATHDMRLLATADQVLLLSPGSIKMVPAADYIATLQPARAAASRAEGSAS